MLSTFMRIKYCVDINLDLFPLIFYLNILIYNLLHTKLTKNLNLAILVSKDEFYLLLKIIKYLVQHYN